MDFVIPVECDGRFQCRTSDLDEDFEFCAWDYGEENSSD